MKTPSCSRMTRIELKRENPGDPGRVLRVQRSLRRRLVRDQLEAIMTLLGVEQHHRDTVPQGEILPREVKALAALVRPDRADTRPDFLAGLIFTHGPTMIQDIGWSVCHTYAVNDTAFSVGDEHHASTQSVKGAKCSRKGKYLQS